jgi:hypothetical protein
MPALIPGSPVLDVEVYVGGHAFTLDDPDRGRLDAGNVLGPTDTGWKALTAWTVQASWRIGATSPDGPLSRFEPGFARVELWDPLRMFDPGNPVGPFRGRLVASAAFRIVARPAGKLEQPQFVGRLTSVGWSDGITLLEAADGLADLALYDPPAGPETGAGETSGDRVARIVANADFRGAQAIQMGTVTLQADALAGTALAECYRVTDAELGALFIDRRGTLTFRDRNVWRRRTPAVHGVHPADAVGVLTDTTRSRSERSRIRNIIGAAGKGLTEETATDQDSVNRWGAIRWARRDLVLQTQAALKEWAAEVLVWTRQNRPGALERLTLWPIGRPRLWDLVIRLELLESFAVDLDGHTPEIPIVVGYAHNVTATDWRSVLILSPHPLDTIQAEPFTVDHPVLGVLDAGNVLT